MRQSWIKLSASLWFIPGLIVIGAIGLAIGVLSLEAWVAPNLAELWPILFTAGAEGARSTLSVIAGSMITIAGVVFSITIVALSLASNQYSPRVLRSFMKDRINQTVLGVLIGVFVYCIVVLRIIHSENGNVFIPVISILLGLFLAIIAMGFLILFIHHIAASIQASYILASITRDTLRAIDHLFPEDLGKGGEDIQGVHTDPYPPDTTWWTVPARHSGYIQSLDPDALLRAANRYDLLVRMEKRIGDFVTESMPLLSVAGKGPREEIIRGLNKTYQIDRQRTVEQDPAFGIRQVVDMALKALSPSINDTTTGVMCIDHLAEIMIRLCRRRIATPYRFDGNRLRVIAREPSFELLLGKAVDQIRRNAGGNVVVLEKLLWMMEAVASVTVSLPRRVALLEHVRFVGETITRTVPADYDRDRLEKIFGRLVEEMEAGFARES